MAESNQFMDTATKTDKKPGKAEAPEPQMSFYKTHVLFFCKLNGFKRTNFDRQSFFLIHYEADIIVCGASKSRSFIYIKKYLDGFAFYFWEKSLPPSPFLPKFRWYSEHFEKFQF